MKTRVFLKYFVRDCSFTILVGIAPLVFLVGSSEFVILEMSSLLTKLKSNNCVVSTDDLILIMLG